ncbi:hypothetical protein OnM2_108005 [Erysiphe neolycopersici]|uniref:ATP synthase protein 8 n=1 Tax=Erysiphe neolycopersici TaxID=212602 RepID=A0A420H6Y6_9PEZI|nr:hypothetical protein OnM2_108005 [Erysiphe neolycopersici]
MPQLVPFYFINQVTFAFVLLPVMIFVLSKYILPSCSFALGMQLSSAATQLGTPDSSSRAAVSWPV